MPGRDKYSQGEFSWAELATSDERAALKFYGGLFGWTDRPEPMGPGQFYHMQELKGRPVAAIYTQMADEAKQGIPPHWSSYLTVRDVDAVAKKVAPVGGKVLMQPFDVFTFGRMAVVAEPSGAVVCLWQAKDHAGAGLKDEAGALTWLELITADSQRATKFLSAVLGIKTEKAPGPMDYTLAKVDGKDAFGVMAITKEMAAMHVPPHWMPYFQVGNCDDSVKKAASLGGKVLRQPTEVMGQGRFAVLMDPQGVTFSIFESSRR